MPSALFHVEHEQGNALIVLENFSVSTRHIDINTLLAGSLNGT